MVAHEDSFLDAIRRSGTFCKSLLNFVISPERVDENTVKAIFLDHFTLEILSFCVNLNLLPLSYLYYIY